MTREPDIVELLCGHSLSERKTACADGACPLCMEAEIERLRAALEAISFSAVRAINWVRLPATLT